MKKVFKICLCFLMTCMLFGCKEKVNPNIELKKDVTFQLLDALQITNKTNNTVYYYFLASIENKSNQDFLTNSISYEITDESNTKLHSIDSSQKLITQTLEPEQSTFICGYVGYPNNNQENMGILFSKNKKFVPFSSVDVRKISDKNIQYSKEKKFTLYKDSSFTFDVDASNMEYAFENGNSMIKGLKITYENKTDNHLVVPYITPHATMVGINLEDFTNKGDFSKMDTAAIKKVDFKTNDMDPRTSKIDGTSTGYECFYLPAKQKVVCDVVFIFEHSVPDFKNKNPEAILIDLNSASLGYSQSITVSY